ncbi:proton-coupled amino acid transporter 1-like [Malaya genurostris]|uniref:proton-coupled amino acid transporter 1-like n=1 Tax=Malaya genurostris TaxID=325434 RepID=UPI0026F397A9|nr:proton-coupled amino acid transporter 1-like [Malaya genurostris]
MPNTVEVLQPKKSDGLEVNRQNGRSIEGQTNQAFELTDVESAQRPPPDYHKDTATSQAGGHGVDSEHPTTYLESIMHIFKGNVGPGLYAMGQAFYNGGIIVSPILTILLGITCVHSQHLLLKSAAKMKLKRPNTHHLPDFADTVELCFTHGPLRFQRWAGVMRIAVNVFICITQLGFCTVYFGFISNNLKQIYDFYGIHLDVRLHMLIILLPILLPSLIRNLKYLAWCMTLANACMILGTCITTYYAVQELPSISERNYFSSWGQLPLYFGTAIFAFEGIALVLPLHNAMKKPSDFGRPLGVLNVGMCVVTLIFTFLGFVGYLKWGDNVKSSLTLNLPDDEVLAQSVKVMVSLGILLGYALQFFIAIQIMLPTVLKRVSCGTNNPVLVEVIFRTMVVLVTFTVAESILNVGALISLIGALCSTSLALVFPPVLELILGLADKECRDSGQADVTQRADRIGWFIWTKNIFILALALFIFVTGTFESLEAIQHKE